MRGHTSSVKTVTFFDPSRSHLDPSIASSIVASAGRDGNILLFDLRCQGRQSAADSPLPLTRPNYSNGVDGFCAQKDTQILEPVMTIRGAHAEGSRRTSPNHHVSLAVIPGGETWLT
jgi:denticleless